MRILNILITLFFVSPVFGQLESLFPESDGDALLDSLVTHFKTLNVLDYDEARDFIYSELDNHNDTVRGIYSNHAIYLPPDAPDASTFLYMDGSSDGINAEHIYPQSKGAREGNARSDMHHLYPARAGVNSARGNRFLGEVDDNLASDWYWQDIQQRDMPTENIDAWSERASQVFEPKESIKGNVARSVFYFYTMYQEQADEADDFFFEVQRVEMCQWHARDPVDLEEIIRTNSVAIFQDDKVNPYILDCTLASRTFCSDILVGCDELTVSAKEEITNAVQLEAFPNPSFGEVTIRYEVLEKANIDLVVYNMLGQVIETSSIENMHGEYREQLWLDKGFYLVEVIEQTGERVVKGSQKVVVY